MDNLIRFEHPRQLARSGLALVVLAVLLYSGHVTWLVKLTAVILGLAIGYLLGRISWRRLRQRVLANNVLITYFEDSIWAAILVGLFLGSIAPRSFVLSFSYFVDHPTLVWSVGQFMAASCTSYAWALYRAMRHYERSTGPLRIKTFYARSVSGAEGLIGRVAKVVEPCDPEGRVTVGSESWSARSLNGGALEVGTAVVIRDVEGLRLIVEGSTHEAA